MPSAAAVYASIANYAGTTPEKVRELDAAIQKIRRDRGFGWWQAVGELRGVTFDDATMRTLMQIERARRDKLLLDGDEGRLF